MKRLIWLFIAISALLLLPVMSTSTLRAQTNDLEANKAIAKTFFEAEAARAYDRMDSMFVRDFVRHSVATTAVMPDVKVTNLEEYKQFLKATAAMFPDYYNSPQMVVAEGNYVAVYSIWSGTFADNGNRIQVPIVSFARFKDGKIAEMWWEWDNVTWNAQMTASPMKYAETPINSVNDIAGTWRIYGKGWALFVENTADGWQYVGARGCAPDNCIDRAQFVVEGNQIHYLSSSYRPSCGEARYEVFVVKQGNTPVGLRFAPVGKDCYVERQEALNGKTLYPVIP